MDVLLHKLHSHGLWPNAALHLTDMIFSKEELTNSGLSDTASNGLGQHSFKEKAMVGEFLAVLFS